MCDLVLHFNRRKMTTPRCRYHEKKRATAIKRTEDRIKYRESVLQGERGPLEDDLRAIIQTNLIEDHEILRKLKADEFTNIIL